jgi:hypothetical protein
MSYGTQRNWDRILEGLKPCMTGLAEFARSFVFVESRSKSAQAQYSLTLMTLPRRNVTKIIL